jgi:hypothetical protein
MNPQSDMWHMFFMWSVPCNNRRVVFLCVVHAKVM